MNEEKPLKELLEKMLLQYRLKGKLQEARVQETWEELMGPMINRYTRRLQVHRRKLLVEVDSAPLRQELSLNREVILKRVNEALGEEYLKEVLIR